MLPVNKYNIIALDVQGNSKLLRPHPERLTGGLLKFGAYS